MVAPAHANFVPIFLNILICLRAWLACPKFTNARPNIILRDCFTGQKVTSRFVIKAPPYPPIVACMIICALTTHPFLERKGKERKGKETSRAQNSKCRGLPRTPVLRSPRHGNALICSCSKCVPHCKFGCGVHELGCATETSFKHRLSGACVAEPQLLASCYTIVHPYCDLLQRTASLNHCSQPL